jgi:SAM-dependent methyltransferase
MSPGRRGIGVSRAVETVARRTWARLPGVDERTPAEPTNTQFLIQLSGYRWVNQIAGPLDGRRVLDAASGEGIGLGELLAKGAQVIGIDLDAGAVARCARAHPEARFARIDATPLGFRDGVFDVVVSQDTLEHVQDDTAFVREVHRVLKPAGVLILFTPQALLGTAVPANPYHVREYSAGSLGALLRSYFAAVRLFGRRPAGAMRRAEAGMDAWRRWDRVGLRRPLVPRGLRHRLGSWLLHCRGESGLEALSADDVEYFEGTEGSGTLIAVCRKRA